MIELKGVEGRCFAMLGLGRSGIATALSLSTAGAEVRSWDDASDIRERAVSAGCTLCNLYQKPNWHSVSALIVSPGISHLYPQPHPIVASALQAGVPLDNDIGLFFSSLQQDQNEIKTIAVTGSNGKSTTAALICSLLQTSGCRSRLVGNIGHAVLGGEPLQLGEIVVLELSSYQTDLAQLLAPDIAVFLNLSQDHLDRHAGFGGYFAAKRRLFSSPVTKTHIISVDQIEGRFLASQVATERVVRISSRDNLAEHHRSVYAVDGQVVLQSSNQSEIICDLKEFRNISGKHNHQNACAAIATCYTMGLPKNNIVDGLAKFPGLPHRSQVIGEFNGILCINDSKATNADSASMALESFPRIRWIAGGLAKKGGISSLSEKVKNVTKAYLIGHSAREFALQLNTVPHTICNTIPEAVALAVAESCPGETILLAPAAASFDQYSDFEARGDHFVSEIKRCFAAK